MYQLNIIKLGGGLSTDKTKPLTIRQAAIKTAALQIAKLHGEKKNTKLLIGTGAGSFGHYTVRYVNYLEKPNDPNKIAAVHNSVAQLNLIVVTELQKVGIPAVGIAPMSFMHESSKTLRIKLAAITELFDKGLVPVVFGDVIINEKSGSRIISTEEVLDKIARRLVRKGAIIENVIYATAVSGVYGKDGKTISNLSKKQSLSFSTSVDLDVTGGMAQKVKAGFKALDFTNYVYIIDGQKIDDIKKATLHQQVGTRLIKD